MPFLRILGWLAVELTHYAFLYGVGSQWYSPTWQAHAVGSLKVCEEGLNIELMSVIFIQKDSGVSQG